MSRLYLITGFLGAGKTTFLRRFLPLFSGEKIRLIINEFGEAGVDGSLLKELSPVLEEISGGSVFCACRLDRFEKALSQCGRDETILVEASGLSNPTGVRRLFTRTDRFFHITYMGGICLVDAVRFPKVYATARSSVRQLAASDVVVLNKIDQASPEQLEKTRGLILGQRPDIPIVETSFGQIPHNFLEILAQSQQGDRENLPLVADLSSRKTTITLSPGISAYELTKFIEMFAEETYRVKGLIQTRDQGLVLADCVGSLVAVTPITLPEPPENPGKLTILSGGKTRIFTALKTACRWYSSYIVESDG